MNGLSRFTRTAVLASVCVGVVACGSSGGSGDGGANDGGLVRTPHSALELEQIATCDAFQAHVADAIAGLILHGGFGGCRDCLVTLTGGAALEPALGTDARSFEAFTETNNQESGVDELDQIETDASGNFYLLDGTHLVIANGLPPADLREIARLDLGGYADGLVLDAANRRLVVARSEFAIALPMIGILPPQDPTVELQFVDVTDVTKPVIDRVLHIDGYRMAVRRIGARVHLVSHTTPFMPWTIAADAELVDLQQRFQAAVPDSEQAKRLEADIRARVAALVAAGDPAQYLPTLALKVGTQPFVDITTPNCSNVALPDVAMPLALTAVTSVDSDGTDVASLTVANNSWNVYASEQHVYLIQTSGGWWFDAAQRQQTAIYKIAVGAGRPAYRALGAVDGWAESSFQFSEYAGHLRVAANRWERDPVTERWSQDNHLYVLADDGAGTLRTVGTVAGFGAGERIFSARFMGPRGFVVTFRQIDPLFAFDLSVPQDPRLVGEVEIPGVSTYLHPLDDRHLLTIGVAGNANGLRGGFQLQIFDVQDLREPRRIHELTPTFDAQGFAWTAALYDHLAFNYFPAGGTLTVPVQYFSTNTGAHFSGFAAYAVSAANGFTELGRLDHSDLAEREHCAPPGGVVPAVACTTGLYLQAAMPRRAVSATYAGASYIYTLSNVGMKVSAAQSFDQPLAVLPLPGHNLYPWAGP